MPRNNGLYYVGVENGAVVYRADGDVIFRSGQALAYPLRFGAAFYHGGFDHLGGHPTDAFSWEAYDGAGAAAGATWTAPAQPGRYKVIAGTSNWVFGTAFVSVRATFPWPDAARGWTRAAKFLELPAQWRVVEQEYDDLAADYNLVSDAPVRRWRIEFQRLRPDRAAALDDFYELHRNNALPFYFRDPRRAALRQRALLALRPRPRQDVGAAPHGGTDGAARMTPRTTRRCRRPTAPICSTPSGAKTARSSRSTSSTRRARRRSRLTGRSSASRTCGSSGPGSPTSGASWAGATSGASSRSRPTPCRSRSRTWTARCRAA